MSNEKKYFGNAKIVQSPFGEIPTVWLSNQDLKDLLESSERRGQKGVSLSIKKRKDPDNFGNTHNVELYIKP